MKAGKLGLLSVGLIFGLAACDLITGGGTGPTITSFSATPGTVAAGSPSVLAWSVDSTATTIAINNGVGTVTSDTDDRFEVTPTATTTYTLTATNASGATSTRTATVTVTTDPGTDPGNGSGGGGGGNPDSAPEGTFGVSTTATGEFLNDVPGGITSDADPRIIAVPAGTTFYAEVEYTDPDGIEDIAITLVNSSPAGLSGSLSDTPRGGFALVGEPTGSCTLGSATTVTCVYAISVAAGTTDIAALEGAGTEFAYVFRALVTDGLGNSVLGGERGYVNVQ